MDEIERQRLDEVMASDEMRRELNRLGYTRSHFYSNEKPQRCGYEKPQSHDHEKTKKGRRPETLLASARTGRRG